LSHLGEAATFPIVAIGASAGGLEAFSNLLRSLPAEPGIALIFIPHLDPTHDSAMVELLSRTTRLPVHQAVEGAKMMLWANRRDIQNGFTQRNPQAFCWPIH
jgi:chemotaxis response regulator CheB